MEEYKYRPPFIYIAIGVVGIVSSTIFGLAIGTDTIWFSVIMGIFSIMALLIGIGFLSIFIRKYNTGNLVLGEDFIEIPLRFKDRVRLKFHEILQVEELFIHDCILGIESQKGFHVIEQNWMKNEDFENLKIRLQSFKKSTI